MTTPTDAVDLSQVMARISAIQSHIATLDRSIATSTGPTAFANALSTATAPYSLTGTNMISAGAVPTATTSTGGAVTGQDVVNAAEQYLGTPYVFAGTTKAGIDCSGLVQSSYKSLGIDLPRISWQQQKVGTEVPSLAQAQPGDILCFGDPAYHVAIYLGNNKLIESPQPGETVHITDVYQQPSFIRRVVGSQSPPASAGGTIPAGVSSSVASFATQFASAEAKYGLPAGLLAAVCQQESGGNTTAVSPAGAEGLMQFMPGTAAGLGVDPWDPSSAIDGAGRMFSGLLKQFGSSIPLALAAYNAGAGAVERYNGIPPYAETQNYVRRITQTMGIAA